MHAPRNAFVGYLLPKEKRASVYMNLNLNMNLNPSAATSIDGYTPS